MNVLKKNVNQNAVVKMEVYVQDSVVLVFVHVVGSVQFVLNLALKEDGVIAAYRGVNAIMVQDATLLLESVYVLQVTQEKQYVLICCLKLLYFF